MSSAPSKPVLRLNWCSYEAAMYAVTHWHYSGSLPTPPLVRLGAWEGSAFIGCVLFSRGANQNLGNAFDLGPFEVCELTRVALREHESAVSKVVGVAIRLLKVKEKGLRLIVSFADPLQGHVGSIYQAGNWIYTGTSQPDRYYLDKHGRKWHSRQCSASGMKPQYGVLRAVPKISECTKVATPGKHRYVMPLDSEMRAKIAPLAKPYPKRVRSAENGTEAPTSGGGVIPTRTLQS